MSAVELKRAEEVMARKIQEEIDQDILADMVKQSLADNPPAGEQDEFNALVGIQHKPRIHLGEVSSEPPRAIRRINLIRRG